jgi:hypothetical protein
MKLVIKHCPLTPIYLPHHPVPTHSSGRAVKSVGLHPLACWNFGFRIPPKAWRSVSSEYCALSGRGLCDGPIFRAEESCRVCTCH